MDMGSEIETRAEGRMVSRVSTGGWGQGRHGEEGSLSCVRQKALLSTLLNGTVSASESSIASSLTQPQKNLSY